MATEKTTKAATTTKATKATKADAIAATFAQKPAPIDTPAVGKTTKTVVNDQVIDQVENDRYPRDAQSENFTVRVVAPATGIPMVQIAPKGWVGPFPLSIPEVRLDELVELLAKIR